MNLATIRERVLERLDESTSSPVHYTAAEVNLAINESYRLLAFLTLCLEKTATFSLSGGATDYTDVRAQLTDYIAPLRITVSGARVRPETLHGLDFLNSAWEAEVGTPTHYVARGFNLFAFYPHPSGSASLSVTYAYEPADLSGTDTPAIPEEYHPSLVDEAVYLCRLKEGGGEFQKSLIYHERFLQDCAKLAKYVRGRSIAQGYDKYPAFDLEKHDISRQIAVKQLPKVPIPVIRKDSSRAVA